MSITKTLKASGLHCSSCSMLITMSIEDLDGVESVDCNHATGITRVTFDERLTDVEHVEAAIVGAGYRVEIVD